MIKMIKFCFFGTDEFAVTVLEQLKAKGFLPALIVTTPDKPKGRKLVLTPPPVKVWAEKNKIQLTQGLSLREPKESPLTGFDLFVVASYGKIIPKSVLYLPKCGTLNIHPSLLPKYRGPSPIQTAILNGDRETGVTIMLVDEQVDHGPIVAAASLELLAFSFLELRDRLAKMGADLLAQIMPKWMTGKIKARPQNHALATFTKKIKKSDGEIKLDNDPQLNYRKFLAYQPWPGIYFLRSDLKDASRSDLAKRVKITDAALENGIFIIKRVVPEGRPAMRWEDYQRGL